MPASICDPVSSALRLSLNTDESQSSSLLDSRIYSSAKNVLLSKIEFEESGDYQANVLDGLKSKYVVIRAKKPVLEGKILKKDGSGSSVNSESSKNGEDGLPKPKRVLFPLERVQLGWQSAWAAGAGMQNMGNTCYLNSTLQALFHVPALANWLVSESPHSEKCNQREACVICGMRDTLMATQKSGGAAIKPWQVYSKLRLICRHLTPGRQEDGHEFLRYLVEAMEKCYLSRFPGADKMEQFSKETTPLNQILGGYLRSTVRCLACHHLSTTYQHFQDLLLDIRKHSTLDEALESFFSRERLEDLGYKCEACNKKVSATKQFFIERAPAVLCVALKRFSLAGGKLSKHIQFRKKISLHKYLHHRGAPGQQLSYKLVSMVTHLGPSQNCGHYTAIGQAPNGNYYQFDDSCVRPLPLSAVLGTNAYIMFFERDDEPAPAVCGPQLPDALLGRDKSPLKLSLHKADERKPLAANGDAKPVILNGTLGRPPDAARPEPWVVKQNGEVVPREDKLCFTVKRPAEDGGARPKAKSDSDVRPAAGTDRRPARPAKSPLERMEEQMNKTESVNGARNGCNGTGRLVPYDSESSGDERDKREKRDARPGWGPSRAPDLHVATKSTHQAWTVSSVASEASGPLLSPSLNGDTIKKHKDKEESDKSPNTSVSTLSPLSAHSDRQSPPEREPPGQQNPGQRGSGQQDPGQRGPGQQHPAPRGPGQQGAGQRGPGQQHPAARGPGQQGAGPRLLAPSDTLRSLQGMSHRGYGAPVSSWAGTNSHMGRQVSDERRDARKRQLDAYDDMDRGRAKKTRKFPPYARFNNDRHHYNPFQEKQNKPQHWGGNFKPHYKHYNKYNKRFNNNRYSNGNGNHYSRHH